MQPDLHWSGLSDEAVERISNGTAPLLFDRDINLLPVVADFEDFLEELEQTKREQSEEKKVWQF